MVPNSYAKEKMELMKDAEKNNKEEEVESKACRRHSVDFNPSWSLGHPGKKETFGICLGKSDALKVLSCS